jgi:hypothetical protein
VTWTTAADLRAQVQRLWDRGDLLRALVAEADTDAGAVDWPLRLTLRVPSAFELTEQFDAVREWVTAVDAGRHVRIERQERRHRVLGAQQLPVAAWVDTIQDAVALIGKVAESRAFTRLWQRTAAAQPLLLGWIRQRPLVALELADRWERLLAVVAWLQANPRPAIFLRQVDVPGVDSKFIEAHRGVLTELLDAALPAEAIEASETGVARFARRYGFLEKPERVRFRLLDPSIACLPGCSGPSDVTLDVASFSSLALSVDRVLVTENETNFLALPQVARAIVVFGGGYGAAPWARAPWLQRCRVDYWGDIDTHGFAILDQLRSVLPHARSLLMDGDTLLHHRESWGEEPEPVRHDLMRLSADEAAVYDDLRLDRLQSRVRLEQERIGYRWVLARLGG